MSSLSIWDADKLVDVAGVANIESDPTTVDETPVDTESESAYDFSVDEASDAKPGVPVGGACVIEKSSESDVALGCAV